MLASSKPALPCYGAPCCRLDLAWALQKLAQPKTYVVYMALLPFKPVPNGLPLQQRGTPSFMSSLLTKTNEVDHWSKHSLQMWQSTFINGRMGQAPMRLVACVAWLPPAFNSASPT
jgi:hypothetical protein